LDVGGGAGGEAEREGNADICGEGEDAATRH